MILRSGSLALSAGALASLSSLSYAVPSINVGLRTSFGSPPYLVELLYVKPINLR